MSTSDPEDTVRDVVVAVYQRQRRWYSLALLGSATVAGVVVGIGYAIAIIGAAATGRPVLLIAAGIVVASVVFGVCQARRDLTRKQRAHANHHTAADCLNARLDFYAAHRADRMLGWRARWRRNRRRVSWWVAAASFAASAVAVGTVTGHFLWGAGWVVLAVSADRICTALSYRLATIEVFADPGTRGTPPKRERSP